MKPAAGSTLLLPITMPVAPAASALATFVTNGHVPRSTYAHLPVTAAPLVKVVQPSVVVGPVAFAASVATTTSAVTGVVVNGLAPVAATAAHGPARLAGAVISMSSPGGAVASQSPTVRLAWKFSPSSSRPLTRSSVSPHTSEYDSLRAPDWYW